MAKEKGYTTKTYRDVADTTKALYRNGERAGFVNKTRNEDGLTRYGMAVDNVGSPYRGVMDREINTPVGSLDYGYDGDTVYAGVTPNVYSGLYSKSPLVGGGDMSGGYAGIGDYELRGNVINQPGQTPMYAAGLNFPDSTVIPNYYGEVNTPLGKVFGGTNDGNPNVNAGFQPNARTNYYIQALANLLGR